MKLYEIIQNLKFIGIKNYCDLEIDSLTCTYQEKTNSGMFFCIKGKKADGHEYAQLAVKNGVVCLVVEQFLPLSITQILVEDVRKAMSYISSIFYKTQQSKMKFIGITGTNGKTTTTFVLREILNKLNCSVGLIGTEGTYINSLMLPPTLTTPDPIDLHKLINDMDINGCEYCIMEVSAHSIALNKIDNIMFDVVGLTNITNDHLDFFINMDNYLKCKLSLFSAVHAKTGIVNAEVKYRNKLPGNSANKTNQLNFPIQTFGNTGDFALQTINMGTSGTDFSFKFGQNSYSVHTNMIGEYNIMNLLLAVAVLNNLGFDIDMVVDAISKINFVVPGRFNILEVKADFNVIVDYAHTPDGIKNVLITLKKLPINRLITVFGCGGDRDKTKRNEMGKIATQLSDITVVTTDNPRNENPNFIIEQITQNLNKDKYIAIEDRATAINYALSIAKPNDVVAILGKGAENYQEIKGIKYCYSDYAVVDAYFKQNAFLSENSFPV